MKTLPLILITIALVLVCNTGEGEAIGPVIARLGMNIGRRLGGSGKPVQHFKDLPNRKAAENAARNAGKGNKPVQHAPHKPGQTPHFHPADRRGNIIKDGSHYGYPRRQG